MDQNNLEPEIKEIKQPENIIEPVITFRLALVDSLGRVVEIDISHADLMIVVRASKIEAMRNLLKGYMNLLQQDIDSRSGTSLPSKQALEKLHAALAIEGEFLTNNDE